MLATSSLVLVRTMDRPGDEFVVDVLVHDEVQVALSEPCLLVLESKVQVRQHVEARREEGDLRWNDAQLTFLGLG